MQAALRGQAEIVEAQLAAGVPADGSRTVTLRPRRQRSVWAVIDALVARGADVEGTDSLDILRAAVGSHPARPRGQHVGRAPHGDYPQLNMMSSV